MLKIENQKWGQSNEELRKAAVEASNPRSRERYMALYEISEGRCATQIAKATARHHQTVMKWVHRYNREGPEGLEYRHTGGRSPLYAKSRNKKSKDR